MAEAIQKINFTRKKRVGVRNGYAAFTEEQEICYNPLQKMLYNYRDFSDEERSKIEFLAAPNFLSMN